MRKLVFVDCEATGPCPGMGVLTEFGAVDYSTRATFHGVLFGSRPSEANPALSEPTGTAFDPVDVFTRFTAHDRPAPLLQLRGATTRGHRSARDADRPPPSGRRPPRGRRRQSGSSNSRLKTPSLLAIASLITVVVDE